MATKRITKKPCELRQIIYESGLKYVMLNNRLFDNFLSEGKSKYSPIWDEEKGYYKDYKDSQLKDVNPNDQLVITFNDKDLIILILLKFLQQAKYKGYTYELAEYLNMSEKRLKEHLKKLKFLKGDINNGRDDIIVPLISEKAKDGWENGKKRKFLQWKVEYNPDYEIAKKDDKHEEVAKNFFRVTLYDLDLYTSGQLNEKEFITYLYFIKSYNSHMPIWHTIEKVAEKVNVKNPAIIRKVIERLEAIRIKNEFCDESNKDFPLIHIDKPENYTKRIRNREDPSCSYKPIYNMSIVARLNDKNPNIYNQEVEDIFL